VGVWMGYDDNRPLTGVTGGGLPAEIWREVMVRVNEGLPARPLPMQVPTPRDAPVATDGAPLTREMTEEEINQQIIQDVLGTLGNN
jgi:penicillin-binding protein 1A